MFYDLFDLDMTLETADEMLLNAILNGKKLQLNMEIFV
jgi:hypothetical protein